jgi:hypothetical protein
MSEGPPTPEIPTPEQINAAAVIDPEALKRWFSLPENGLVLLNASRADMDRLFLGLRLLTFAQGDHLAAFQQFSQGNIEEAQRSFASAAARNVQALANLTLFTAGVMEKAQPNG